MTQRPLAVITGASAGIGMAFARALAARGHDLILVARRIERLEALAAELHSRHGVTVESLAADLALPADVERVERRLAATPHLELLINNAGFGTVGHFAEVEPDRSAAMVHVHVTASVRLTRAALTGLLLRGRGAIINVSSLSAFNPTFGNAIYSATKAFLVNFSQSLNAELRATGVRVQALCPGFTYTEFHDTDEYRNFSRKQIPRFMWMSADKVVAESLAALQRGPVICVPGAFYKLAAFIMRFFPVAPLFFELIRARLPATTRR